MNSILIKWDFLLVKIWTNKPFITLNCICWLAFLRRLNWGSKFVCYSFLNFLSPRHWGLYQYLENKRSSKHFNGLLSSSWSIEKITSIHLEVVKYWINMFTSLISFTSFKINLKVTRSKIITKLTWYHTTNMTCVNLGQPK